MTVTPPPTVLKLQDQARFLVMCYINEELEKEKKPRRRFKEEEVYLVWFSKTLENWKALVGTVFDATYYEVTHSGVKRETYVDVYEKVDNVVYPDVV